MNIDVVAGSMFNNMQSRSGVDVSTVLLNQTRWAEKSNAFASFFSTVYFMLLPPHGCCCYFIIPEIVCIHFSFLIHFRGYNFYRYVYRSLDRALLSVTEITSHTNIYIYVKHSVANLHRFHTFAVFGFSLLQAWLLNGERSEVSACAVVYSICKRKKTTKLIIIIFDFFYFVSSKTFSRNNNNQY